MPMRKKYGRRYRRKTTRKTFRRRYKKASFRSKVKNALMDISETKSIGRVMDDRLTVGNIESEWRLSQPVFPVQDPLMIVSEGTGVNDRIGNRITLMGMRIPVYIMNQTAEALRIRVIIIKTNANPTAANPFMNPIGLAEPFNYGHPWQADWALNKELGSIVKQRTFTLKGAVDWGSVGALHDRLIQHTGNSGVKRLEMGFSLRKKKHHFDNYHENSSGEFKNIDQYVQLVYVWRLFGNDMPYVANHGGEGLGNVRIRQFHKLYFKDV